MKTIFSQDQLLHAPRFEVSDGRLEPAKEIPTRAQMVLDRIHAVELGEVFEPNTFSLEPIKKVHDEGYLRFLEGFWEEWLAAGRKEEEAFPFVWPVRELRNDVVPEQIDGKLGYYSFDAGSPLGPNTWKAARKSADTALTGASLISGGERTAFALCRPPGHHAHNKFFGGYCFLNNAAIAAQSLLDSGAKKVSILDVDYHHGNGTQALFYDRADVQFLSIHADPKAEFPYFLGHADEKGIGAGEGFNHNYPLPLGTAWDTWSLALHQSLEQIKRYDPDVVIISLGMDPFEEDPISWFKLQSDDFLRLGQRLAALGKPTLFVMEGGYAVEDLGINCVNVLTAFEEG
ncbi:histone deacetylase family protein [Rhodobacteraceae bacterium RKSG542]|uniref:histone deacetylase family protein n=1 Tax=Pseudovibrio flavus TaxID=2529854 RepID=UPI0012BC39FA|nr:histone deacetylase family protein [Pseudovibrio flavus]MTI17197.1 histone deacetylase family protein [Pseudovibrio flavus]